MKLEWEGKTYHYDHNRLDVKTAMVIKAHTGMGLKSWSAAVDDLDPAACQALYWAIMQQNDERVEIATLNFSIPDFMQAFTEAALTEMAAQAARDMEAAKPDPMEVDDDDENIPAPTPTLDDSEISISSSSDS